MNNQGEQVLLIGASSKPERYAYKAMTMLTENGHTVIPVNPREEEILGVKTISSIQDVSEEVTTVTIYVNPKRLEPMIDNLIALKPKRVIFNPGTEDPALMKKLTDSHIQVVEACTLVLLRTEQF